MTIQTVTGYDLLNDEGTSYPNIHNGYLLVSNFDPSITSSVANFSSENWVAKTKGSDSYDQSSFKKQTIALKSTEGSTLTFTSETVGGDPMTMTGTYKGSWDFLSSDGIVKLHTATTSSMKDGKFSSIETYTNLGGPGKVDDINATWNNKSTSNMMSSPPDKYGNQSFTSSSTLTFSYIGNGLNFNVSTKNSQTYKGDSTGTNTSNTNNTTITKYNLLNTDSEFNINLTGVTTYSKINNGVVSDKTFFSKVALIAR